MRYLSGRSDSFIMVVCVALVAVVGFLDWLSGSEASLAIVYLVPITIAAWQLGRRPAIIISLAAITAWFLAIYLGEPDHERGLILDWNGLVFFGFFVIVSVIVSSLRAAQNTQEQLAEFLVHDLRSPLIAMQMSLNMLEARPATATDERQARYVRLALASSERMMTLINSLLDLARLEQRKMPIALVEAQVANLVRVAVDQLTPWAIDNQVEIATDIAPKTPKAHADIDLTERVLVNILGNAIKHSPADSTVSIQAMRFGECMVAIKITNRGPGVPKEWVKKVFDRFAQVNARKAGGAVGTGLGLAFCRLAVEAQGGHIWMESEPGIATTVTFTLPAAEDSQAKISNA